MSVAIEDDKSEISVDQDESVRLKAKILALAVGVIFVAANAAGQQFQLMEASVSDIRRATQSGKLTCHSPNPSVRPLWRRMATQRRTVPSEFSIFWR